MKMTDMIKQWACVLNESTENNEPMTVGQFVDELSKLDRDLILQFDDRENENQLLNRVVDINDQTTDDRGRKVCTIALEYGYDG